MSNGWAARSAPELVKAGLREYEAGRHADALKLFQEAALLGDADAMYRVGNQFRRGEGVKASPALARQWFIEAARRGSERAMAELGWLYETGLDVPANAEWALNWYGVAAKRGSAYAMFRIGWMFDQGKARRRDPKVAARWYTEAASRGESMASNNLGVLYDHGELGEANSCEANRWFEKALAQDRDNDIALTNLGTNLLNGKCPPAKEERAVSLLERAAKLGNSGAKEALQDFRNPSSASTDSVYRTETRVEYYHFRRELPPPPPPVTYTPPISPFYGEPCWGC